MSARPVPGRCLDCRHFCNDPAVIERTFPGLTALSSGYADVRANDGLCARHGLYLALTNGCAEFEGVAPLLVNSMPERPEPAFGRRG